MSVIAARNNNLNVLEHLLTKEDFKKEMMTARGGPLMGSNLLMIAAFFYNFEMVEWILANLDFDISAENDSGKGVLSSVIRQKRSGLEKYRLKKNIENDEFITNQLFYDMVMLLVQVGKADVSSLMLFLLSLCKREESELAPGQDEMVRMFMTTPNLIKKFKEMQDENSCVIMSKFLVTRYADLIKEVHPKYVTAHYDGWDMTQ
jgi:hypothetical protein